MKGSTIALFAVGGVAAAYLFLNKKTVKADAQTLEAEACQKTMANLPPQIKDRVTKTTSEAIERAHLKNDASEAVVELRALADSIRAEYPDVAKCLVIYADAMPRIIGNVNGDPL